MRLYSLSVSRQDVNLEIFRSGEKIAALVRSREATVSSVICCRLLLFRFNSLSPNLCYPFFGAPNGAPPPPRICFVWSLTCLTITPDLGWCRGHETNFSSWNYASKPGESNSTICLVGQLRIKQSQFLVKSVSCVSEVEPASSTS